MMTIEQAALYLQILRLVENPKTFELAGTVFNEKPETVMLKIMAMLLQDTRDLKEDIAINTGEDSDLYTEISALQIESEAVCMKHAPAGITLEDLYKMDSTLEMEEPVQDQQPDLVTGRAYDPPTMNEQIIRMDLQQDSPNGSLMNKTLYEAMNAWMKHSMTQDVHRPLMKEHLIHPLWWQQDFTVVGLNSHGEFAYPDESKNPVEVKPAPRITGRERVTGKHKPKFYGPKKFGGR